jgi:hypothetical protein
MTTYAYDTSTRHLVAVWDTGIGAAARTVARLHARTDETVAMNLAAALTRMSDGGAGGAPLVTCPSGAIAPARCCRCAAREDV